MLSLAVEEARTDADRLLYGARARRPRPGRGRRRAVRRGDRQRRRRPAGRRRRAPPGGGAGGDGRGRPGRRRARSAASLTVVDPAAPGRPPHRPVGGARRVRCRVGPSGSDVVLVEMSDLERADRNGLPADGPERDAGLAAPLRGGRRLLGQLLERVDLSRDRVIVVSPGRARRLRAPDHVRHGGPGRRAGRGPQRHDPPATASSPCPTSAPTVLDSLGLEVPASMNAHADHLGRWRRASTRRRGLPAGRRRRDRPLPGPHRRPGRASSTSSSRS